MNKWIKILVMLYFMAVVIWFMYFIFNNNKDAEIYTNLYHTLICSPAQGNYFITNRPLDCVYKINSTNEDRQLLPKIRIEVNGYNEETPIIQGIEFNNITFNNMINISANNSPEFKFTYVPKYDGNYKFIIYSQILSPPYVSEFKESTNLSFLIPIRNNQPMYTLTNYNSSETNYLKSNFQCFSPDSNLWNPKEIITCTNKLFINSNKDLNVTTTFYVIRNFTDVTSNSTLITISKRIDLEHLNELTSQIRIKNSSFLNWDYSIDNIQISDPGEYIFLLKIDVYEDNLDIIKIHQDNPTISFTTISYDNYIKINENSRTISFTVLIAIIFSIPIALRALKELGD